MHMVVGPLSLYGEKKEKIWLSQITKALTPTEKWKHKNPTKTSTTQRLRTDLGWSVGETTAT